MVTRSPIFVLFAAVMAVVLTGCGGSTTNIQNPPAPPSSSVSIAFQPAPAKGISLNATTPLTAVVTADPSDAGVDWALLCQSGSSCGKLSPLHTASGTAASYTPPATISGNSQTFTIEAFATADHTKNVVTAITVTGFAGTLKGTYVFAAQGTDANGSFQLAGAITLDGNGGITSGEQTRSDYLLTVSDPITGGSYYIGPDGRGTLTLNTADVNIGQLGVENLTLVVLSSSRALIATADNPILQPSFETSSGTLDLQTSTAAPTAGYAFSVNGTDIFLSPMAMGGILNIDSPNAISGAGSVIDQNDGGSLASAATLSGTLTAPDSFGSFKVNLVASFTPTPIRFTGYIVDGLHVKLIESDDNVSGAGFGSTAGVAIGQGANTGTFTSNPSFAGNYVFGILGQDFSGLPTSLASVGQFNADANGNLTGYNDEELNGLGIDISDSFTGTYLIDATGTGRVDSSLTYNSNGPGPEFIFYLTGSGNPPLVLDSDVNIGSIGAGLAYSQAATPLAFDGKYGLYITQNSSGLENDITGQITVDGSAGTISGVIDSNLGFSPQPNTDLEGTFGTISPTGRATGTLNNTFFPSPGSTPNTVAVAFYLADSNQGFFIETDSSITGEMSFGYFDTRTPVCPNCQAAKRK